MRWTFDDPPRLPLIAPSILSADFAHLAGECQHVLDAGADLLHVDVMDGHFVPNLTMGPALVKSLRRALPEAFLDVHLMVTDPGQYVVPFAQAGADHLTFNIEPALDERAGSGMSPLSAWFDPAALLDEIRGAGMSAGFAVNPATSTGAVSQWIDQADMILVMSVNPGFSGQAFMGEVVEKVRTLRGGGFSKRIEMDGGLGPANAGQVREAGCDVLVAATSIFGHPRADRARAIADLRGK